MKLKNKHSDFPMSLIFSFLDPGDGPRSPPYFKHTSVAEPSGSQVSLTNFDFASFPGFPFWALL